MLANPPEWINTRQHDRMIVEASMTQPPLLMHGRLTCSKLVMSFLSRLRITDHNTTHAELELINPRRSSRPAPVAGTTPPTALDIA